MIREPSPDDLPGDGTAPDVDILDRRGRLARFGLALAIGGAVTAVVMIAIFAAGVHRNDDAVSQVMPFLLGAASLALTTTIALGVITRLRRRERPGA